jgi:hypothetical protein
MSRLHHEQVTREALASAETIADTDEAARLLLAAIEQIPRFPAFAESIVRLSGTILDPARRPDDMGLVVDALRWLLHAARIVGADPLLQRVGEVVDGLEEGGQEDARVDWIKAMWRTAYLARTKGYAAAQDAHRIAASKAERIADEGMELDLRLLRLDIELRHDNRNAALQQVEGTLELLEARGEAWDGERYHLENARNLILTQRDDSELTLRGMMRAYECARRHEATNDVAQSTVALIPLLLHMQRSGEAVTLAKASVESLQAADGSLELEMALWQLQIKAHEVRKDLNAAVQTGFTAIARAGAKAMISHYVNFCINVASLYFQADMPVDAYHMLQTSQQALEQRGDSSQYVLQIEQLRDAMVADLGPERMAEVIQMWKRREQG